MLDAETGSNTEYDTIAEYYYALCPIIFYNDSLEFIVLKVLI